MKTVSLELAKQLAESGYPQNDSNTHFWYRSHGVLQKKWYLVQRIGWQYSNCISAPTADEILDLLPRIIKKNRRIYWLEVETQSDGVGWACQYKSATECWHFIEDKELADTIAKMWIYLKNKHLL